MLKLYAGNMCKLHCLPAGIWDFLRSEGAFGDRATRTRSIQKKYIKIDINCKLCSGRSSSEAQEQAKEDELKSLIQSSARHIRIKSQGPIEVVLPGR